MQNPFISHKLVLHGHRSICWCFSFSIFTRIKRRQIWLDFIIFNDMKSLVFTNNGHRHILFVESFSFVSKRLPKSKEDMSHKLVLRT